MQQDNCVGFMKRKCVDDEVDDDNETEEDVKDKRCCLMSDEVSAVVEETIDLNDRRSSVDKKRRRRGKKMGIRRHKRFENDSSLGTQSQDSVAATCATAAVIVPETESIELEISKIGSIDAVMSLQTAPSETVIIDAPSISSIEAADHIVSHTQEKEKTEEGLFVQPTGNRLLENKITDKPITLTLLIDDLKPPPIQETLKDSTAEPQDVGEKSSNETTNGSLNTCMTTFSDFCHAPRKGFSPPDNTFQKPNSAKTASRERFIYGNYNRYYGYRSPELEADVRLACFPSSLFEAKTVLDIGCNVGHVTMLIARDWKPMRIVGIDIDRSLVAIAKKNIRHYVNDRIRRNCLKGSAVTKGNADSDASAECPTFPNNVVFMQGNYVLERDDLVDLQREEYDVILALSISKWIHLNWGDEGLKRTFRRIFRQLRPGGKLVLEPQEWSSYKRKKKLTDAIFKNYQSIRFLPQHFRSYLLSEEVGFSSCEMLGVPDSKSKGFRRPLLLFTKKDVTEIASTTEQSTRLQSTASQSGFDDEKLDSIVHRGSPLASPADVSVNETAPEDIAVLPVAECDAVHNSADRVGIVCTLPSDTDAVCSGRVPSSAEPAPEESTPCTVPSEVVTDIEEVSRSKDDYSLFVTVSSPSIARGKPEDSAHISVSSASCPCPDTADGNLDSGDVDSKEFKSPLVNSTDDWMPAVRTVYNGGLAL